MSAKNGTTWSTAASGLVGNSNGWEAADNMSGSPQALGFYAATPLPATLPLFVSGLGFVGYLTRRRKQSSKQALVAA